MAYTGIWQDNLPWSDNESDRKLVGYVFISLIVCTILYTIVQFLPLQEVKEKKLEEVSPRLARLIIEHQKKPVPPPPIPQPKKKETPKPEPKKAEKVKPTPEPKKTEPRKAETPKPDRGAIARRQAQQHITEIQDALADLRDMNVASTLEQNKPVRAGGGKSTHNSDNTTAIIAAQAGKGSGGINTSRLSRATGDSHLQGRQTTAVTSSLASGGGSRGTRSGGSGAPSRPYEEIELVFQKNKGSIFSLYSRALRRDPTLQGKVVLELTIAPSGQVTNVRIVSSEINNPQLLEQLKNRVKLFRFQAKNVDTLIVKYPIDFLPT
jgi:protein TonB